MRRRSFLVLLAAVAAAGTVRAQEARKGTLYKNPQCGCCEDYATYLRKEGFQVAVVATHDLDAVKAQHHVPENLYGCHTTLVGGYVVEGHVPASTIERLLRERPRIRGISLPGMPQGSPGMTGKKTEPFRVYEVGSGSSAEPRVYAVD
jgi:hypothetical protein